MTATQPQSVQSIRPVESHPQDGSGPSWWRRVRRYGVRLGIPVIVLAIFLIPYPYHAGGGFRCLPVKRAEVRSEVEGLVEAVLVREGEWVEAGQPIARISVRTHERNLKATQARLEEAYSKLALLEAGAKPEEVETALADVRTAETSLSWSGARAARYTELHKQKLVSDQDLENAMRQRDIDEARLSEAKSQLELVRSGARREEIEAMLAEIRSYEAMVDDYRVDVQRTELNSPIAGRIVTPRVEEMAGTYVKPGQRDLVVEVEDSRVVQAVIEVPEENAPAVRTGATVTLVPWAYFDRSFEGKVISIAPIASTNSDDSSSATVYDEGPSPAQVALSNSSYQVVRVITEIPNPDGLLKTDMTGYAKIATEDRPVGDVLLRPIVRWFMVQVWYWIP